MMYSLLHSGVQSSVGAAVSTSSTGLTEIAAAFPGNLALAALDAVGPYSVAAGGPHPEGGVHAKTLLVSDGVTTIPVDFDTVQRNVPSLFNDREFTGRVDVQLTSKDRVGARYIFQQNILTGATAGTNGFAAGAWVGIPARAQQIALACTHTFSGRFFKPGS